ncbi:hypothetical protein B0O99DRAFT_209682 [Bisporella sp. PMI_857]|nr:hypothetical protein B0O99DRAFT_209682 [Bisporella sp. PMI_857]
MAGDGKVPRAATDKEAHFFLTILGNMKNAPEVDWDAVAQRCGYSNATCAKTRFSQIKKAIGWTVEGGSGPVKSPAKAKPPKKTLGSGTIKTPSKVTKPSKFLNPRKNGIKLETNGGIEGGEDEDEDDNGGEDEEINGGAPVSLKYPPTIGNDGFEYYEAKDDFEV